MKRAFTLIELMVLVAIIAIIAAIVIPNLLATRQEQEAAQRVTGVVVHKYYRESTTQWVLVVVTDGHTREHVVPYPEYEAAALNSVWPPAEKTGDYEPFPNK